MTKKKLLTMGLALSMVLSSMASVTVSANDRGETFPAVIRTHSEIFNGSTDQYKGKTVILHSNDVHGQIDGYAIIAELEDDFEEAGAEVITVDAGDYAQGSPYVNVYKGQNAYELMGKAGYEFATFGNHEFNFGISQIKAGMKKTETKILCANATVNGELLADAKDELYTTKGGTKIGFFGMVTPETVTKANPALIKGLSITSNAGGKSELNDCAKQEITSLKSQGADIIIAITHLGMDYESSLDGHRSADMYKEASGLDLIIDGHSHDAMTEGPNKEPIQSTGAKFANIGVVVIDDASKKIGDRYLVSTEGLDKDPEIEAAAKKYTDEVDKSLGAVFAKSKVTFASDKTENRCYETNTGDLVTDAMMWEIGKDIDKLDVDADHVVAITNGGGLRDGLPIGDITKMDINKILPFGNTITVIYVTGDKLLEVLEASTFNTPDTIGGFPQTKGIKFTIDTTKAFDQGELYGDTTYYAPKSIQRVTIESINGKAFDKKAKYAVVTNDFISEGGDTYYIFGSASSKFDTGYLMDEVVSDYIATELNGVLSVKRYGKSRGDITILPDNKASVYEYDLSLDKVSISKLKAGKNKLTVTWNKTTDDIDGYQISYSTSKKFTKKTTKTINVTSSKTKSVIKKLNDKTTYYVRIRAKMKWDGKTYYSDWSKTKKVKIG